MLDGTNIGDDHASPSEDLFCLTPTSPCLAEEWWERATDHWSTTSNMHVKSSMASAGLLSDMRYTSPGK